MPAVTRSFRNSAILGVTTFATLALATACKQPDAAPSAASASPLVAAPDEALLKANDPVTVAVLRGRALLNSTEDSLPKNDPSMLRCTSCHLNDGRRAFGIPWVGSSVRYPQYRARSGKIDQLADRINDCFERALNGRAIDPAGKEMNDIIAYITWLSKDVAAPGTIRGQGIDSLPALVPDTAAGATLYQAKCIRCHAPTGGGTPGPRLFRGSDSTIASPLWGPKSFNIGAGMARRRTAASFIHSQMPLEAPGSLTAQEATNIAGYVEAKPRPDFAGKARDYPKGGAPPDVAYQTQNTKKPAAKH